MRHFFTLSVYGNYASETQLHTDKLTDSYGDSSIPLMARGLTKFSRPGPVPGYARHAKALALAWVTGSRIKFGNLTPVCTI